jgi:hypothetical protein
LTIKTMIKQVTIITALVFPLAAQADQLVVKDFLACQHKEVNDRLGSLSDDTEAFTTLALAAVTAGECRVFHTGDRLILSLGSGWFARVKVRVRGELVEYESPAQISKVMVDAPC